MISLNYFYDPCMGIRHSEPCCMYMTKEDEKCDPM
jgi:hypothetical protein